MTRFQCGNLIARLIEGLIETFDLNDEFDAFDAWATRWLEDLGILESND